MKTDIQQRTSEWFAARLGKITASNAYKLVSDSKNGNKLSDGALTYILSLIAETISGEADTDFETAAMAWGNAYERVAIESFEKTIQLKVIYPAPLFTLDSYENDVCSSPDALIEELGSIIEIKCPQQNNHIAYHLLKNQHDLKTRHKNIYWQLVLNMLTTKTDSAFFVSFHPGMPTNLKMKILHVDRVQADCDLLISKIDVALALKHEILSELLGETKTIR